MISGPRRLIYRQEGLIRGRLLTVQSDLPKKDLAPHLRPWLGSAVAVDLREEYRRFQCKKCGRADELKCFRRGLPADVVVPKPRPDLHVTDEYFSLWSRRLADAICELAAEHMHLFNLPGEPGYVVPWPKRLFTVPKGAKVLNEDDPPPPVAFRPYSRPCADCGRFRSMTFAQEFFEVPEDVVIAAVGVDTEDYPQLFRSLAWIVSADVAGHLQKRKLSNILLRASFANS